MAIIDKHAGVKIDKAFSDKHVEMFAFFDKQGIDVEVSDDFTSFRNFLTRLSVEEYPYRYDLSFEPEDLKAVGESFALMLKAGDDIVATYAAKHYDIKYFIEDFKGFITGDDVSEICKDIPKFEGEQMYSSCQWVSKDHRGKGFGMILDHLKKNICFDIFGADVNYAIHKSQFADYHIKGLHYDESKWLSKGSKEYNLTWIKKDSWVNKLNDVRKLYS